MQIAFTCMTDGFTLSTRHLSKQINYNMKFLVSKGKRQQIHEGVQETNTYLRFYIPGPCFSTALRDSAVRVNLGTKAPKEGSEQIK